MMSRPVSPDSMPNDLILTWFISRTNFPWWLAAPLQLSDELLLYSTHGLGPAYKELVAALRTRDTVVPFEELFNKITDQRLFSSDFTCSSCLCNKSQHLRFGESSLKSRGPLDSVYIDGRGGVARLISWWMFGGRRPSQWFRLLHYLCWSFTKYSWFCPLRLKSAVFLNSRQLLKNILIVQLYPFIQMDMESIQPLNR